MCKLAPNDCKTVSMPSLFKLILLLFLINFSKIIAQPITTSSTTRSNASTWTIQADSIDPSNYYGITVANGMIGLVSSTDPFKAKDVVLNGAFDLYGRGRVSNILKTFNFVNLYLDIDGDQIDRISQTAHLRQVL